VLAVTTDLLIGAQTSGATVEAKQDLKFCRAFLSSNPSPLEVRLSDRAGVKDAIASLEKAQELDLSDAVARALRSVERTYERAAAGTLRRRSTSATSPRSRS